MTRRNRMTTSSTAFCVAAAMAMTATTTTVVRADLEVGSFFGANWRDVELEVRTEFHKSLSDVRSYCASEATGCPLEVQRFCGYENGIYYTTTSSNNADEYSSLSDQPHFLNDVVFGGERNNVVDRHVFDPSCDLPHLGKGCFLQICFHDCFENRRNGFGAIGESGAVSRTCHAALSHATKTYEILRDVEDMHDERESIFRRAIIVIPTLSMIASILVLLLNATCDDDDDEGNTPVDPDNCTDVAGSFCAKFCIVINWISVIVLLSFVILLCPKFLLMIVPPFALVHAIYYGYVAFFKDTTMRRVEQTLVLHMPRATVVGGGQDGQLMEPLMVQPPKTKKVPVVYHGIPVV